MSSRTAFGWVLVTALISVVLVGVLLAMYTYLKDNPPPTGEFLADVFNILNNNFVAILIAAASIPVGTVALYWTIRAAKDGKNNSKTVSPKETVTTKVTETPFETQASTTEMSVEDFKVYPIQEPGENIFCEVKKEMPFEFFVKVHFNLWSRHSVEIVNVSLSYDCRASPRQQKITIDGPHDDYVKQDGDDLVEPTDVSYRMATRRNIQERGTANIFVSRRFRSENSPSDYKRVTVDLEISTHEGLKVLSISGMLVPSPRGNWVVDRTELGDLDVEATQRSKGREPLSTAQAASVAKMLELRDYGDVKIACSDARGASKDFEAALAFAAEQQLTQHGYLTHVTQIEVRLWLACLTVAIEQGQVSAYTRAKQLVLDDSDLSALASRAEYAQEHIHYGQFLRALAAYRHEDNPKRRRSLREEAKKMLIVATSAHFVRSKELRYRAAALWREWAPPKEELTEDTSEGSVMHNKFRRRNRFSPTFGAYYYNQFFIQFKSVNKIFNRDGSVSESAGHMEYAVLIHEYVHYLQNISTVSGYYAFNIFQDMASVLSNVIEDDFSCQGSASLGAELKSIFTERYNAFITFVGDYDAGDESDDYSLDSYRIDNVETLAFKNTRCLKIRVENLLNDEEFDYMLGTVAIEESVAFEIDRVACGKGTVGEIEAEKVSVFPYKILRLLSRYRGVEISPETLVRLGTIALNTPGPGAFIDSCLQDLAGHDSIDEDKFVDMVISSNLDSMRDNIKIIVQKCIPEILNRYENRGLLQRGIESVCGDFVKCLNLRSEDLLFDVDALIASAADSSLVSRLMVEILPCDVLQSFGNDSEEHERDIILSFGEHGKLIRGEVETHSDRLRSVHSQIHYLYSHLGDGILEKSSLVLGLDSTCPFFYCCPLEMRVRDPGKCEAEPWTHSAEETCTYADAIKSTRPKTSDL